MRIPFLIVVGLAASAASRPAEYVVSGDGVVSGMLNGVPARMRIDPAAPAVPITSTELANRAGLKAGPFDFEYLIGGTRIGGKSAVTRIDYGLGSVRRRVGWTTSPYRAGADATIGPGLIAASTVRFNLRPIRPGERTHVMPMVGQGGIEEAWGERFGLVNIGGSPVRIQFDPGRRRTVATASAGARLASVLGAQLSGATSEIEIAFGVIRPVRTLQMKKALMLGRLTINELSVRSNRYGSAYGIPEAGSDPNEIVVTGGSKKRGAEQIKLGADILDQCSSIVFDKTSRQVRLSCLGT